MKINADKEKGGAIGVNRSKKSPIINVSTNVGHSRERQINSRGVMYS